MDTEIINVGDIKNTLLCGEVTVEKLVNTKFVDVTFSDTGNTVRAYPGEFHSGSVYDLGTNGITKHNIVSVKAAMVSFLEYKRRVPHFDLRRKDNERLDPKIYLNEFVNLNTMTVEINGTLDDLLVGGSPSRLCLLPKGISDALDTISLSLEDRSLTTDDIDSLDELITTEYNPYSKILTAIVDHYRGIILMDP